MSWTAASFAFFLLLLGFGVLDVLSGLCLLGTRHPMNRWLLVDRLVNGAAALFGCALVLLVSGQVIDIKTAAHVIVYALMAFVPIHFVLSFRAALLVLSKRIWKEEV